MFTALAKIMAALLLAHDAGRLRFEIHSSPPAGERAKDPKAPAGNGIEFQTVSFTYEGAEKKA